MSVEKKVGAKKDCTILKSVRMGLKKVFKSLIPDGPMKLWSFRVRGLYFIQADGATDRKAVRKEK